MYVQLFNVKKINNDPTPDTHEKVLNALGLSSPIESLLILPTEFMDTSKIHDRIDPQLIGDEKLRLYVAKIIEVVKKDHNDNKVFHDNPHSIQLKVQFNCGKKLSLFVKGRAEVMKWLPFKVHQHLMFSGYIQFKEPFYSIQKLRLETQRYQVKAVPIYLGISGKLSGADVLECIKSIGRDKYKQVNQLLNKDDFLIIQQLLKYDGYRSLEEFVTQLHQPTDIEKAEKALLIARKISIFQIQDAGRIRTNPIDVPLLNINEALMNRAKEQPEKISDGQSSALNAIRRQINEKHCSRILLNGDVGSGKTLVFLLIAAAIADCGLVSCILVPNEIVARQIHAQCVKRFGNIKSGLVTGNEKEYLDCQIIIGTQALLFVKDMPTIGLLIVDEQHKFSSEQRQQLISANTHVIEASATPIPRSLALALFCDWTEVPIKGMPVKKNITSYIFNNNIEENRKCVVKVVSAALKASEKVIFLYATVGSKESSCIKAAERLETRFPGQVTMVHGKLKADAKNKAMEAFKSGEKPILIASTAIEVGVDVPNVTTLIINQADRFGVSQLHQIRGRLVRNGGSGHFFMMLDKEASRKTLQRLEIVRDNTDGFKLAELDMDLRGFGELLNESTTQSGNQQATFFKLPRLTPADFYVD